MLNDTQINAVMAAYEAIVRRNTDDNWDAVAEVAADDAGEVIYEVWDTAHDLGFTDLSDADRDALGDATYILKDRLAAEVAARVV